MLQIQVTILTTFIGASNRNFPNNEILQINGRDVGTLEAAWSYQLTDVRSSFGKDGSNNIRFGCNWILNDSRPIEASTIDVDQAADDELTGFRTRFEKDLRPGDVVTTTFPPLKVKTHFVLRELILLLLARQQLTRNLQLLTEMLSSIMLIKLQH